MQNVILELQEGRPDSTAVSTLLPVAVDRVSLQQSTKPPATLRHAYQP